MEVRIWRVRVVWDLRQECLRYCSQVPRPFLAAVIFLHFLVALRCKSAGTIGHQQERYVSMWVREWASSTHTRTDSRTHTLLSGEQQYALGTISGHSSSGSRCGVSLANFPGWTRVHRFGPLVYHEDSKHIVFVSTPLQAETDICAVRHRGVHRARLDAAADTAVPA